MGFLHHLFIHSILFCLASRISSASDTLRVNQVLRDRETLVSSNNRFELGFFVPGTTSNNTYLGIWYKNLPQTIVWVANRNNPIVGSLGRLSLFANGFAVSYDDSSVDVFSVNSTTPMNSSILRLLNNGNLVFTDEASGDSKDYAWQGFDYITNNLLPDMKLGWNLKTGHYTNLTSWSSDDDPSSGEFTFWLDSPETPQLVLTGGTEKQYRWGPWDGVRFSGNRELRPNPVFSPSFSSNGEEVFYTFRDDDDSTLSRFVVTQQGLIQYLVWSETEGDWTTLVSLQSDGCDGYGVCGSYGSCYKYPTCKCLKGFQPKSPEEWKRLVTGSGCERKWNLSCGNGDGFVKYKALKLPDKSFLGMNRSLRVDECEADCLRNCSCTAYAWLNIHNNDGNCVMWTGDLVDMRNFPDGGEELFIRMARQEIEAISDAKKRKRLKVTLSIVASIFGLLLFGAISWFVIRRKKPNTKSQTDEGTKILNGENKQQGKEDDLESPLYDLAVISSATEEFSFANKIGEGGFGSVYWGVLPSGQEVAVKRLSQSSGQGVQEFKNEVNLIEKLQHRNLVKLLGCCVQGEERMLVYEYLPNKSLDFILFDPERQKFMSWKSRFNIIMGIARGLLYLHQDSRLRIIHRDLKASNILLDTDMNPKISDFGLARIFGGDQTQEKTKRVIGTYGYMSPEYALSGHFSVKSDVFSFGVLVLEIVTGRKNWGFYHPDHDLNLLGHAWKLWNEDNPLELMTKELEGPIACDEVIRCIKVGLLCVQQRVEDRPIMSTVLFMLANEKPGEPVPEPKEPGFVREMSLSTDTSSSGKNPLSTNNLMTVTILDGR